MDCWHGRTVDSSAAQLEAWAPENVPMGRCFAEDSFGDERLHDRRTRWTIETPQALHLRFRQLHARHLPVFRLDTHEPHHEFALEMHGVPRSLTFGPRSLKCDRRGHVTLSV